MGKQNSIKKRWSKRTGSVGRQRKIDRAVGMFRLPRKETCIHNLDRRGAQTTFWSRRPTITREGQERDKGQFLGKQANFLTKNVSLARMTSLGNTRKGMLIFLSS